MPFSSLTPPAEAEERYMEIAIIGAGNVGKALAKSGVRAGHKVTLSSANPEHAEEAARATGAKSAPSNVEAAEDAEVVIEAAPDDQAGAGVPADGAPADLALAVEAT